MESTNNNNQLLFLSEFKELKKELSAVKKRIVQLEESHEKQQERINILERENHSLKKKKHTELNNLYDDNKQVESTLKRKRTDQDTEKQKEIESKTTSVSSAGKKKAKISNNNDEEAVVIPQRDNGDSFESLSDDLLHKIVEFDGNCYSKFGLINKRCKNIYDVKEYKLKKQTCVYGYGTLDMILERYLQKRKEETLSMGVRFNIAGPVIYYTRLDAIDWIIQLGDVKLLNWICIIAASYGRINILTKVFLHCNLTKLDKLLKNTSLCYNAAKYDKLETLKWLRNHGAKWNANTFYAASDEGYDEIVQYLRNGGCPETHDDTDESSVSEQFDSDDEDGDN